jgi:hypothetical protein
MLLMVEHSLTQSQLMELLEKVHILKPDGSSAYQSAA